MNQLSTTNPVALAAEARAAAAKNAGLSVSPESLSDTEENAEDLTKPAVKRVRNTLDAKTKRFMAFGLWIAEKISVMAVNNGSGSVSNEILEMLRIFDTVDSQKEFYNSFNEKLMIESVSALVKTRVKEEKLALKQELKNKTKKNSETESVEKATKKPRASKKKTVVAETQTDNDNIVEHENVNPSILLTVMVNPVQQNPVTESPVVVESKTDTVLKAGKTATNKAKSSATEKPATKKSAKPATKKSAKSSKSASPVSVPIVIDEDNSKPNQKAEYDEDDEDDEDNGKMTVESKLINGKVYLQDTEGNVYDFETHEPIDMNDFNTKC
jgi:hypothetical protein